MELIGQVYLRYYRRGRVDVTVLGLVGGAPGGETPRVADSLAAGAGRFFHNRLTPSASVSYLYGPRPGIKLSARFIAAFASLCGWHYKIECSFHRCVCKSLRLAL